MRQTEIQANVRPCGNIRNTTIGRPPEILVNPGGRTQFAPTETLINANMGFATTIGCPPKLWLNHKFDIKNRWLSA